MGCERNRNFCLISYLSEEVIQSVLRVEKRRIRHYAYIRHDKDVKEDGSPQEVHFHILLQMQNAMTLSAVRNLFPKEQNTLGQVMRDKSDCFSYLDHSDLPDKFHYDHKLIVSDDIGYWQSVEKGDDGDDKLLGILEDIIAHVPLRTLAKRYGRDCVIYYERYREFAFSMADEDRRIKVEEAERLRCDNTPVQVSVADMEDYALFADENGEIK